jgi:hypothetical protein
MKNHDHRDKNLFLYKRSAEVALHEAQAVTGERSLEGKLFNW